jgi:hypothetical protein
MDFPAAVFSTSQLAAISLHQDRETTPEQPSAKPASASEVRSIVGPPDDTAITRIIATGATAAEVLEAYTWFTADDQLGTETERACRGRAAEVYGILGKTRRNPRTRADDRQPESPRSAAGERVDLRASRR